VDIATKNHGCILANEYRIQDFFFSALLALYLQSIFTDELGFEIDED